MFCVCVQYMKGGSLLNLIENQSIDITLFRALTVNRERERERTFLIFAFNFFYLLADGSRYVSRHELASLTQSFITSVKTTYCDVVCLFYLKIQHLYVVSILNLRICYSTSMAQ